MRKSQEVIALKNRIADAIDTLVSAREKLDHDSQTAAYIQVLNLCLAGAEQCQTPQHRSHFLLEFHQWRRIAILEGFDVSPVKIPIAAQAAEGGTSFAGPPATKETTPMRRRMRTITSILSRIHSSLPTSGQHGQDRRGRGISQERVYSFRLGQQSEFASRYHDVVEKAMGIDTKTIEASLS